MLTAEQKAKIRELLDNAYEYGIKSTYSPAKARQYDREFVKLVKELDSI